MRPVRVPDIYLRPVAPALEDLAIGQLHPDVLFVLVLLEKPGSHVGVLVVIDAGPVMIACVVCFHPRANGIGAIEYPCGNVQFVGRCHRYVKAKDAAAEIEAQRQGAVVACFAGAAKNDALRAIIFIHQLPAIPGRLVRIGLAASMLFGAWSSERPNLRCRIQPVLTVLDRNHI